MKHFIVILISLLYSALYSQSRESTVSPLPIHSASSFMENKGQWDDDILFKSSFKGGNLWVQRNKFLFHLQDFQKLRKSHGTVTSIDTNIRNLDHLLYLSFKNSSKVKNTHKDNCSKEYYNFFLGNDKNRWTSDVHSYTSVELFEIYKGVNLRLIQEDEQLKYEFIVSPNSDPTQIQLEFFGAKSIEIDREGRLHISTPLGELIEKKPYVYQIIEGEKQEVKSAFKIIDGIVTFQLNKYDTTLPLIIDPILVFATYNGAYSDNFGMTATYGYDGTAYSGGTVFGSSYPTIDPNVVFTKTHLADTSYKINVCSDIFITKYSADGSKMLWSTFLGGGDYTNGAETVHSLICDKDNNIYGFGASSSINFPITTGCFQSTHQGGTNIIITNNGAFFGSQGTDIVAFKLSQNGHQLLGSTYIGGSGNDGLNYNYMGEISNYSSFILTVTSTGNSYDFVPYDSLTSNYGDQFRGEIFLDSLNNIIIGSSTRSIDFPLLNPFQSTIGGKQDGILLKLSHDFKTLLFSSYIGGNENDAINSTKLSKGNEIIFCGGTSSSNLNTSVNAYQKKYAGGKADGFFGKLDYSGKSLKQLSYVGENLFDQAFIIESDNQNNIYIVGHSIGGKFPIVNATYSNPNSTQFIAKFDSSLITLTNSTVYGNGNPNTSNISPAAFLVDDCNNIYVSGWGANIIQDGVPYVSGIFSSNLYFVPGSLLNNMPLSPDAFSTTTDHYDFHLFVLDKSFSKLIYGSYLGGNLSREHVDGGTSRFDKKGIIYQSVCGGCQTQVSPMPHSDFPVTANAWSKTNNSDNCNNLVFKFDFELIPPLKINGQSKICVNQTDSLYVSVQSEDQIFTFDWSPKKIILSYPSLNSALVKIDTTQTIFIKAQGNQGCIITDSMQINLVGLNLLNTLASANKTKVIKGDNVQLFGKPDGFSYLWTPEDKVLASHSQNTEATIWDNTIFTLKVMDGPCAASDTILIKVIPWNCDFPYVFVPNAFSPNGDGENDVLYVRGHPIKTIEFRVFNRWGELVFESHDINQGWDGIFKGKLVDPDVFDYYLNVTCVDEEHKQIQGNITVLR